jgi:hypothetical protein
MVAFPLRVDLAGAARFYRDRQAVEQDFDRIFTPRVRRAILRQRVDRLVVRKHAAIIGKGELWLRETCPNPACSPAGPVRIVSVTP